MARALSAGAAGANTSVTSDVDVPEVWSNYYVDLLTSNLVADKVFMDFSSEVSKFGDKINIPENKLKQTAASFTQNQSLLDKLQADTESSKNITVNQYIVNPFVITDMLEKQSKYREKAMKYKKAAFAVAKNFDTTVLALSSSFTTTAVNSGGATLTNLDLTEAWATLNGNDVPTQERSWIFDPWCIKDLYDLTGNYFTSVDFGGGKSLVGGGNPTPLLGSPVYISTNMPSAAAGSPAQPLITNIYAHKEAIGWAAQFKEDVQEEYMLELQGTLCNVRNLYGASLLDGAKGVKVMRQSVYGQG